MEVDSKFILNFIQFLQDQLPSLPPLGIMGYALNMIFTRAIVLNPDGEIKELYRLSLGPQTR